MGVRLGRLRDGYGKQDYESYQLYTYTYERQSPGQTAAQGRDPGVRMDKTL
jgi:hypothetical protein